MSAPALLNPAGGLRYHFRALRYAATLWQPFRWALGEWLLAFEPPERTLVLVGPSGGYCMQPFFFERFERVVCLEPDPIARFVLTRKLARAPLERRPSLEFVVEDRLIANPAGLPALLREIGDAAVLFSNVLGQLRPLLGVHEADAPALVRIKERVAEAIEGRSFASFHDRVSGTEKPEFEQPLTADGRLTDAEVLQHLYASDAAAGSGELLDHLTEEMFPAQLPHSYFVWQLDPGYYHTIEAVRAVRS